jgi:hypothetical protein
MLSKQFGISNVILWIKSMLPRLESYARAIVIIDELGVEKPPRRAVEYPAPVA